MTSLNFLLLLAAMLFCIGLLGILIRRSLIVILMCLELMLAAAMLNLVAFNRYHLDETGLPATSLSIFIFFIIAVAAAEAALGLALVTAIYKQKKNLNLNELNSLREY